MHTPTLTRTLHLGGHLLTGSNLLRLLAGEAFLLVGLAWSAAGQSPSFVYPSSVDAGAGRSTAANVTINATIGGIGGLQVNPNGSVRNFAGFSGQTIKIRPVLGRISFSFPSVVSLPLFGEDDLSYRVQTSTNLLTNTWVTIWTGRTINGVAPIVHPSVAFEPHRFYRANQLP